MPASTAIKFFVHTNTNMPQLSNTWGCLIDVLDACLVNGVQVGTVSSLTASGTTVTATFGSAHNLQQYQVIKISGATQSEYNVEAKILTVPNANSFTFALASAPSVNTATGTISCKLAALGFEKSFSGTQKAAYRSTNTLLASRPYLRVDNSRATAYNTNYAKYAKVGIVETMTGIDTMSGVQAPYNSSAPTRNWNATGSGTAVKNGWAKWYYACQTNRIDSDTSTPENGNRKWLIIGTGDYFYLFNSVMNESSASYPDNYAHTNGFGAFDSFADNDSTKTFLSAVNSYKQADGYSLINNTIIQGGDGVPDQSNLFLQRVLGGSAYAPATTLAYAAYYPIISGNTNYTKTAAQSNCTVLLPILIAEIDNSGIYSMRGTLPFIYRLPHNLNSADLATFKKDNDVFLVKTVVDTSGNAAQIAFYLGAV